MTKRQCLSNSVTRMGRGVLLVVAILWTISPGTMASADEAAELAVIKVIQTQLDAFKSGDHDKAYAQAAPSIQTIFPSIDHFMNMVRSGYSALIDPSAVDFVKFQTQDDRAVQEVVVLDKQGRAWKAYYLMEQQQDGSWRIAGVHLEQVDGESA